MILRSNINAIIFDMDGVLWNSSQAHAAAYRSVLKDAGLIPPEYSEIAGRRTDEVMQMLLTEQCPRVGSDLDKIQGLTRAKQALALRLLREDPPVVPECRKVIKKLAKMFTLGLASSASTASVDTFLEASGTRSAFSAIVSGDDVGYAKPNPLIYLEAMRRLGIPASSTAVVEDAISGVIAAMAAKAQLIIGITGTTSSDRLSHAGAHLVINRLQDLLTDDSSDK
jgi:HAD superfamily hydrolase (TIGR01509 family)